MYTKASTFMLSKRKQAMIQMEKMGKLTTRSYAFGTTNFKAGVAWRLLKLVRGIK